MTRRIRSLTVWLMILTLTLGSSALGATAQQDDASDPLFEADGVDATSLAQADIGDLESGATLLLELIELAPETELPTHRTTSPELLYTLGGAVTFQDNFGFASVVDASQVVSLNAGTEYTISNAESEAGRLLRLRLAGGADATADATPAAGADDAGTTVLMQAPLNGIELEGGRLFLGRAQFGAGSDSGEQAHAGPLGIYVDSGTLNVVSPSGLVGAIDAGRAVSLPAARARGGGARGAGGGGCGGGRRRRCSRAPAKRKRWCSWPGWPAPRASCSHGTGPRLTGQRLAPCWRMGRHGRRKPPR